MIQDLLIPLATVGLAELGDKSQLSVFLLASKTKRHFSLLLAVMLAFLIADGTAVAAGAWAGNAIPLNLLRTASAAVFIAFGLTALLKKEKETAGEWHSRSAFMSGFLLVFVAELGDKTQIASAIFAAKYNAIMVFAGVMLALLALSITAVYLGKLVASRINTKLMERLGGLLFITIGLSFIFF